MLACLQVLEGAKVRLINVGAQRSKVADDIRAGLTALGRGDAVVGGIALLSVKPQGPDAAFDAIVVLPRGVLLIAGVDLPGPAMRLDAPLRGQWKSDNWPLVGSGEDTNPGSFALAAAQATAQRLHSETGITIPIAAILATGPFVDTVVQPEAELAEPVRVLFPTPAALREAIAALAPEHGNACTVEEARAVLRTLDPNISILPDSALTKEGFLIRAHATRAVPAEVPAAVPDEMPADDFPTTTLFMDPTMMSPSDPEADRDGSRKSLKVLPIAALCLVIAGIIAAIVLAAGGADGEPTPTSPESSDTEPASHAVAGYEYTVVATSAEQDCAAKTFGDVKALLERKNCGGILLGSYTVRDGERTAAVSIAEIEFATPADADELKRLAAAPGSGGALDAATESAAWQQQPSFDNAAYHAATSAASENRVRLIRTAWQSEASSPDDSTLGEIAKAATKVPLMH